MTGEKARDNRIETLLQTLKTVINNVDRQEQMGVPADPIEKQLYARLGMTIANMCQQSAPVFHQLAQEMVQQIGQHTGAGKMAAPSAYDQKVQQAAGNLAKLTEKMIQQGVPAQIAEQTVKQMVIRMQQGGMTLEELANMQADIHLISKTQMAPAPTQPLNWGDQFNEILKNNNTNPNVNPNRFPF